MAAPAFVSWSDETLRDFLRYVACYNIGLAAAMARVKVSPDTWHRWVKRAKAGEQPYLAF